MQNVQPHRAWRLTIALGSVAGLTAILWLLQRLLAPSNLLLCYVPLVVIVAIRYGRTAAAVASFSSFLAYNFFFVPPLYTLTIEQRQNVIELVIFLAIALLVGTLAARERAFADAASRRAEQMTALYTLSQEATIGLDRAAMLTKIAGMAHRLSGAGGVEIVLAGYDSKPPTIARAGNIDGPAQSVPIVSGAETLGQLRVFGLPAPMQPGDETSALLTTIANQIALKIERARSLASAFETRTLREADRLKSALLSSVSHDLRTPLAVIKGAASNLLDVSMDWDPATRRAFAATIVAEADRLNRFMRNLLEMSRLEGGTIQRQRTPVEISDVIGPTVQRLRPLLADYAVDVHITPDLPPVAIDAVQIELVMSNLLENAVKFAPAGTPITITAQRAGDTVLVTVADRGPGIPSDQLDRIFQKFYRLAAPEQGPGGTGLGLAICQGIVEAHGGRIWATNRTGGGTCVQFTLPLDGVAAPVTQLDARNA